MVVELPLNTPYDQVTFYATASLARKDRLVLQPPLNYLTKSWDRKNIPGWVKKQQKKAPNIDFLVYRARVREDDSIDEYTRDPRYVTVYWKFGTHGVSVQVSVARLGEEGHVPNQTEQRETSSRYGLVDLIMGPYARNLWDIKTQH